MSDASTPQRRSIWLILSICLNVVLIAMIAVGVDVDFRTHMIPHHEGAIAMAKVALKYANDAETKRMAQKIIDDQEKEVANMQAWLKKKGD